MGLAALGAAGALAMGGASAIGAVGGAIAAGTLATVSLGTVFTAIATVGAVVGAVGAVTGVGELKTAGMVLGGIGGIGSLASAVGAFGEAATVGSVFGGAAPGTDAATGIINGGFNQVSDSADDILGAGAFGGETSAAGGAGNSMDILSAASKLGGAPNTTQLEGTEGPGTSVTGQPPAKDPLAKQVAASTDVTEGPTNADNAPPAAAGSKVTGTVDATAAGTKAAEAPSFWGSQNAGLMGMGVIQAAGSFMSGAFDELKPAQAAAYNAQANANNAQAALSQKELSNMNSKIPVARRMAVTGQNSLINPRAA